MLAGSNAKYFSRSDSEIRTPGTIRLPISATADSSERRTGCTAISVLRGSMSKSCRAAKEALSLTGSRIYRRSCLWAGTIAGGEFRYAATIAPGCCGDAAPNRGSPGCVLGRPEIVSRLCPAQEFPQRRRSARSDEHHADAQDRPARRANWLQVIPARSKRTDAER